MAESWQDEARGIPVWAGAKAVHTGINGWPQVVVLDPALGTFAREPFEWTHAVNFASEGELFPDLTDPDTRAAFVRRLALRLGAAEEQVDECVGFRVHTDGGWSAVAGIADEDGVYPWMHSGWAQTADRLLALVRAWRSVEVEGG